MTSHPPPRPGAADGATALVTTHAAPRTRTVDDPEFPGTSDPPHGTFRLQVFTAPGVRPVALAVQVAGEGPSLANRAETYAAAVWRRHLSDAPQPPVWIERQLISLDDLHASFELVTFHVVGRYRLAASQWCPVTAEQVEQLIGQPVDAARGDGYVPPPAEPEEIPVHVVTQVADLPVPRPFRRPRCMPRPKNLRRLLPRRRKALSRPTRCCWYHRQDWQPVCEYAIAFVERAHRSNVPGPEVAAYALQQAREAGISAADADAMYSLLVPGRAIVASPAGYTNGQHRIQAMRDQGVPRTITVRWELPTPS